MPNETQGKPTGLSLGSQMRIYPAERELIRRTFAGNEELIKLMRKIFLPEIDPAAPIGQVIDLWMTVETKDKDPEQIAMNLIARNTLIQHVDQQLMQLKVISEMEPESPEEAVERLKKDSTK